MRLLLKPDALNQKNIQGQESLVTSVRVTRYQAQIIDLLGFQRPLNLNQLENPSSYSNKLF